MRVAMLLAMSSVVGSVAHAAITTVFVTPEYANENFGSGTLQFGLFVPELTVTPYPVPANDEQLISMVFGTHYAAPGVPNGAITGNNLPLFPDLPIDTPGFYLPGGLMIQGVTLDSSGAFGLPSYDPSTGNVNPAALAHGGDFNLTDFGDGEGKSPFAYVGYCSSDKRRFGYVQLEWLSPIEWRLIGYSYGGIDEPVTVTNLVPAPGALGAFGLVLAIPRSRRR
jgi:hypothetical protein